MNNTTITTTTLATPRTSMALVQAKAIRNSYMWVLVGVGFPGNLACLATVLSMPVTTATIYVALLAVADSLALLVKLVFHQIATHGRMTKAACVLLFTPSFFSCYANWVLVLICFERFFTVCFPLKKRVYITKRRVYISVAVLALAMAICFIPTPFFYFDPIYDGYACNESSNEVAQNVKTLFLYYVLNCIYFFIPFLLITVFIVLIIVGLGRNRQSIRRTNMRVSGGTTNGSAERSMSIMLLAAGLVFLVLTLPVCLYQLGLDKLFDNEVTEEYSKEFLLYQVFTMLSDANHAVNFVIYFVSAAKFRRRFMKLLKRCLRLA